jgi:hypothetical protein
MDLLRGHVLARASEDERPTEVDIGNDENVVT